MFNSSRGGQQTGRGGVQQRRDASRTGRRQENGSSNRGGGRGDGGGRGGGRGDGGGRGGGRGDGGGRGGGRGDGGGRGGGRGDGRGRGGGRGDGGVRGGGRGDVGGRGDGCGGRGRGGGRRDGSRSQRGGEDSGTANSGMGGEQGGRSRSRGGRGRGDRREHMSGHHQGGTTRNTRTATTGNQQSLFPFLFQDPRNALDRSNQQASGSTSEPQRGRGGHERGRDGAPEVRRIGFKTFEGLLDKEPSEVAISLSSSLGLKNLLDDRSMGNKLIQLVCQVLCKAFQARNDRKIVLHLANVVKSSAFFRNILPYYVTGIMSENFPARRQEYPQHLNNIISLLADVLNMFPYSSVQSVSMLVALLKPAVNQLRASGVDIPNSIDEGLERVQGLVDHLQEKSREGTLRSDKYSFLGDNEDAPPGEEDYKTMSIYPTLEEFHLDHNPFLRPNIITQSFPSARIYLDTHFRLLREDFVRPLREGIRELLRSQRNENIGAVPLKNRRFDDIRIYKDTRMVVPLCTSTGIAYTVQFDPRPLQFVRWENSKRLLYGSLVCLSMDNFETFLFAAVNNRDPKLLKEGKVDLCFSADSRPSLARVEPSHSFLMVETTAYFEAYRYVLEGLQEQDENELPFQRYIVECSTEVYPPAYLRMEGRKYDLSSIMAEGQDKIAPFNPLIPEAWPDEEKMGLDESQLRALNLALTHELTIIQGPPGTGKTYVGLKIAQALLDNHQAWSCGRPMLVVCYTNHALDQFLEGIHGFLKEGIVRVGGRSNSEVLKRFALRELTRAANFRKNLPSHLRRAHHEIYTQMKDAEGLLKRQSAQLKCILSGVLKEDFLLKYISPHHWETLSLQPTWDGFERKKSSFITEWLGLGFSTFQQIPQRNGGAEAADSDEMQEEEELLDIDEQADLIQAERILVDAEHQEGDGRKNQRKNDTEVDAMAELMLSMSVNDTENSETAADDEGFQFQKHQKKKMKQTVKHELMKSSVMSEEEEKRETNVWNFCLKDRWRLYRLWVLRYRIDLRTKALQAEQTYQEAAERLNEIRLREDLCVLQEARVIGMTTTGAAKYRQALQDLKPRLVVVEEAAEVMEAHTITTLSQACQHLILIGDHQQLRPSATVYDLARNFNLEVSMFERLIRVGFPFERLNYQHRMRPCIARLLTPHIYAELENHPSVLEYENIKGILTNLFFVDHRQLEEEIKDGRSHQNPHEARFVVALCRYLLCQEYKPSQITILTTYTGQLYCLRRHMTALQFSGVKVHVVDKYQGEENDIVILSLVRSNLEKRVGFLNIPNRVCVALSRAKMALYCIGNMDMLASVPLWSNILHTLRESGQVGRALTLSCLNHPDKQTQVACDEDFKSAPEGGCDQPCQYRLDCGHVCTRMCHPYDAEHKKYQCNKNCTKVLCELGHPCPRCCYQDCGKCQVPIEKMIPSCLHMQKVPCHKDPATYVCQEPCQKSLTCGHPCKAKCGESCTTRCMVKVPMELKCGHTQKEPCFISRDLKMEPQCRTKCGNILKCGHPCPGTCHECYQGRLHKGCAHKCQRIIVCSHECREPCVRDCPPCSFPCENRCVHSICKKVCGFPCTPCKEPCAWQCPHHRCTKLCHEPCDRPPCSVPCNKTLPCGHGCIGLCGDLCPDKCRVCHADEVTEIFFGTEDEPDSCFIQLEDCNHLFESTGMDRYMNLDEDQEANLDQRAIKLKNCPRCRTPIRRNLRYGTHINRSLAAIEMVKEKINGIPAVIRKQQDDLSLQLVEKTHLIQYLPVEYALVSKWLDMTDLSLQRLWELENLMTFLEKFGKLIKMQKECSSPDNSDMFSKRIGEGLKFLLHPNQRFSNQQVSDLEREFRRLSHLAELNVRCQMTRFKVLGVGLNTEIRQLREILEDTLPFSEGLELTVKRMFVELDPRLPRSGLGITDDERVMIVKAIGLNKGHWYKCPNGHVYAIGDCGGAMVQSTCPECKVTIGGANHALAQGNALASEMDGADYAAWSDTANMANFDLQNLM